MKKVLLATMLVIAASMIAADVSAQPYRNAYSVREKQAFYYYPKHNVYYDFTTRRYIYPRNGVWISAFVLPREFAVVNTPRYMVYHNGNDVWRDNCDHERLYRMPYMRERRAVVNKPVPVYKSGVRLIVQAKF